MRHGRVFFRLKNAQGTATEELGWVAVKGTRWCRPGSSHFKESIRESEPNVNMKKKPDKD